MQPAFYNDYIAYVLTSDRLGRKEKERLAMDLFQPFSGFRQEFREAFSAIAQFVDNARIQFQNWSDSQRACVPGSPILADC